MVIVLVAVRIPSLPWSISYGIYYGLDKTSVSADVFSFLWICGL